MNTLTCALVGLVFLFTVPKIYQVYQVPIDNVAKQVLDQINQVLAKYDCLPSADAAEHALFPCRITNKAPVKPKKS